MTGGDASGGPAGEFFSQILPGGLEAWVWRRRGLRNKYAALAVRFGAMDVRFADGGKVRDLPDGTAHFLEHMTFQSRPGGENVLSMFSRLGARANAFTSSAITAYHFSTTENFRPTLGLLLRIVLVADPTPAAVERERRVIDQEIRMYEDNPEARVGDNLLEALYHLHPVRRRITGTTESIGAVTAELLARCRAAFYHPSNLVLVAAGDLEPAGVFELAGRELERAGVADPEPRADDIRRCLPDEPPRPARDTAEARMPVSRPSFLLGFKALPAASGTGESDRRLPPPSLRRNLTLKLLVDLLFGPAAPLYHRLYRLGLVDVDFAAGYSSGPGYGHATVGGSTTDPEKVYRLIQEGISQRRQNGISLWELEMKRRKTAGHYAAMFDSLEGMAALFLMARLRGENLLSYPGILRSINIGEIHQALDEVFVSERACLSVIRPDAVKG